MALPKFLARILRSAGAVASPPATDAAGWIEAAEPAGPGEPDRPAVPAEPTRPSEPAPPGQTAQAAAAAVGSVTAATAADQVARAYQLVLGRPADADGLQAFSEGMADGRQTILDVVDELLHSTEFLTPRTPPEQRELLARLDQDREKALRAVGDLYRTVLQRDADKAGLLGHVDRLQRGEIEFTDLVGEFIGSHEFAVNFSMHRNVARQIAKTLAPAMTGRQPAAELIDSYTDAMASGTSFPAFVDELEATHARKVPIEVVMLAQELIAAQLMREGSVLALPPIPVVDAGPATADQMASLLRTLAMLGAAAGKPAGPAADAAGAEVRL